MTNTYDAGSQVRCYSKDAVTGKGFLDINGNPIDPNNVEFHWTKPDGTTTIYVYGTHAQLVKDGVGLYHVDVDADLAGAHTYRFKSTGTGKASAKNVFFVVADAA